MALRVMAVAELRLEVLLENECLLAVTAAELSWVEAVADDLRTGALGWSYEELAAAVVDDGTTVPEDGAAP